MGATSIQWTDHSVNPFRARLNGRVGHYCEKPSPGCKNCYSSRMQRRFGMPPFQEQRGANVEHFLDASKLEEVLRRKKPTKWFWCDMTDMFGEWVPNEWIAACFGVMAETPWHTHQVLTKRAERLPKWFEWYEGASGTGAYPHAASEAAREVLGGVLDRYCLDPAPERWPLPNVHLGVSVENQKYADERMEYLERTPAAVRWLSCEPLLGDLNLFRVNEDGDYGPGWSVKCVNRRTDYGTGIEYDVDAQPWLDWVVVGGESGPGARSCDLGWIRSVVDQCAKAAVPCFVKQLGARPVGDWCDTNEPKVHVTDLTTEPSSERVELHRFKNGAWRLIDSKGGWIDEWPADLRVRQFPAVRP